MSGTGSAAKLGDLAGALLTLEVNTIVKAGISRVPSSRLISGGP